MLTNIIRVVINYKHSVDKPISMTIKLLAKRWMKSDEIETKNIRSVEE